MQSFLFYINNQESPPQLRALHNYFYSKSSQKIKLEKFENFMYRVFQSNKMKKTTLYYTKGGFFQK